MSNILLLIMTIVVAGVGLFIMYVKAKNEKSDYHDEEILTMDTLLNIVKFQLTDLVKDESYIGVSSKAFEDLVSRKAKIVNAMDNCVYGISTAKGIVQDLIRNVVVSKLPDEESLLKVLDFHSRFLDVQVKFEILMYFYKKRYGMDALAQLIQEYELDRPKLEIEERTRASYIITEKEINTIYDEKMKDQEHYALTYAVMADIVTVLLFQRYKGFGIIDTIRDMNIDGLNCGASGSILSNILATGKRRNVTKATRSVWLFYKGKYIHLAFLSFSCEEELRRIIQLAIRYNNPGPLTEKKGVIVTTMWDKTRILALRPPAAEYWGIFFRKFTLPDANIKSLVIKDVRTNRSPSKELQERIALGENIEGYTKGANIVLRLLSYLMEGLVVCGVTGRQGSGKTVFIAALIELLDPKWNLRIMEMTPEIFARELYPDRNIFSVSETEYLSATVIQDALKKSDAAISIVGEVATDPVAARMVQFAQVASIMTLFSHHGKTTKDLVLAIRNSLVNAGGFSNSLTAEQQVVDVLKIDIHLNSTADGKRYIERVTEIRKLDEGVPYPTYNTKDPLNSMNVITAEYYKRRTDRQTFTTRDILHYDLDTDTYVVDDWLSYDLTAHIMNNLTADRRASFKQFVKENWKEMAS